MVGTAVFIDIFSPEMIELINPTYPRWEKRYIGRKEKEILCECGCEVIDVKVLDPGVEIDVLVPSPPKLCDLIPKYPRKKQEWRIIDEK